MQYHVHFHEPIVFSYLRLVSNSEHVLDLKIGTTLNISLPYDIKINTKTISMLVLTVLVHKYLFRYIQSIEITSFLGWKLQRMKSLAVDIIW